MWGKENVVNIVCIAFDWIFEEEKLPILKKYFTTKAIQTSSKMNE